MLRALAESAPAIKYKVFFISSRPGRRAAAISARLSGRKAGVAEN